MCECLWGIERSITSDIGMDGPQIFGWPLKGCSARAWRCSSPQRAGFEFHEFDWFADLSAMNFDYIPWSCCSSCATFEYVYIATTARSTRWAWMHRQQNDYLQQHCSIAAILDLRPGMHSQCQSTEWKAAATMPDEPVEVAFPSQLLQAMSCVWKDHPTNSNYVQWLLKEEVKSHRDIVA